jgi:hypothetical protein
VTALRDGMRIDAVAVAMRDCPVTMRVSEGQKVGIGVAFTQPSDLFTFECRPVAATLQADRINTKSHRVACGAILILERCDSVLAPYDSIVERDDGRSAPHDE